MKKLVTIISAIAAAGLATAGTNVVSANIVGYNTVTMSLKYNILAVNFSAVDGGNLTIQDAVPYVTGMTQAATFGSADQIQIQNAAGSYDIYFMSNGKNAKGATVTGLEGKWAKAGTFVVSTTEIPTGTAFWYVRQDATDPITITVAGGVSLLASTDKQVDLAYKHIANPYAADLPLNDGVPYVTGMTQAATFGSADQIQIQNAAGSYDIYFMSNGKNAKGATVSGLEGKWAKAGTFVTTDAAIPVGKGAWFCRQGEEDFTITIARPYTIE